MSADLYDAAIVAASKDTSHAGRLEAPDASVRRDNPLCGDRVTLDVVCHDGQVDGLRHHTRGCLLTRAAAALLTHKLEGAPAAEAAAAKAAITAVLEGRDPPPDWADLAIFAPVHGVKSRHECVLLPFQALEEALGQIEPTG